MMLVLSEVAATDRVGWPEIPVTDTVRSWEDVELVKEEVGQDPALKKHGAVLQVRF